MMISRLFFLSCFIFILCHFSSAQATKIYSWVDKNGVRHFSDSSPGGDVHKNFDVKEQGSIKRNYSTYPIYKVKNGYEYCGSQIIPSQKEPNRKIQLVNLLSSQKNQLQYREKLSNDVKIERKKQRKQDGRKKSYKLIDLKTKIVECDCILSWIEHKLGELEHIKDQIMLEARQAEIEYMELKNQCGPEPPPGTYTDPETIKWYECDKKNMKKRNKLRKQMKKAKQIEESLLESM